MSATHELWVRMRCDVELDWCRGVGNTRSTHTLAGALAPLSSPLPRLGFTHDPMIGLLLPILLIYFFSPPSQIGRLSAPTRYKNQDPPWRVRVVQLRSQVVLHVTRHKYPRALIALIAQSVLRCEYPDNKDLFSRLCDWRLPKPLAPCDLCGTYYRLHPTRQLTLTLAHSAKLG